jgi:FSR family fosmidomycin resistance protein-like MFS transporter
MSKLAQDKFNLLSTALRRLITLTALFLLIEFFDEFNYGIHGAVLPVQRNDLVLQYSQIGLLLGLPHLVNTFIEPVLMLLGDTNLRKKLVLGGGFTLAVSLLMTAAAPSFGWLLLAAVLMYPASGAFVTLAQATLIDLHPGREVQMMARWVLSGSLANLAGPLFTAGLFALAFSWRAAFVCLSVLVSLLTLWAARMQFPVSMQGRHYHSSGLKSVVLEEGKRLGTGLRIAVTNPGLMRWIILLQLSDLMVDIFTSYTALYFMDVVGTSETQTSLLLSLFMGAALLSDLAVVYLLERYQGRRLIRFSAAVCAVLYPVWLLAAGPIHKIFLLLLIKLFTMGWYTVLKGEAYAALPERKGTVLALDSTAGVLGSLLPWLVGWLAGQFGLQTAMWLLWLRPVSLLLWVPAVRAGRSATRR